MAFYEDRVEHFGGALVSYAGFWVTRPDQAASPKIPHSSCVASV